MKNSYNKPFISVIIPAYNEEELLRKCLGALKHQNYAKHKYEIIVIDNNSKDKTAKVGKELGAQVYTYSDTQGCGASRHFGTMQAKGDILAFTDADCIPEEDWLKKIEIILSNPKIECVGGSSLPDVKKFRNTIVNHYYDWFHLLHHFLGKPLMAGNNMAVRKNAYFIAGGFDPLLLSVDDWDLAINLGKHFGRKAIHYSPDLRVLTSVRKQDDIKIFSRYIRDHFFNYINLVLLEKRKVKSVFNVR